MTSEQRRTISQAWLSAAEDSLYAADRLHKDGQFRSSVSRSYYSAYSFPAAALVRQPGVTFVDDREGPQHEPLSDMVAEHLKQTLPRNVSKRVRTEIRALYAARLDADYRPRVSVGNAAAMVALKSAAVIATSVRRLN
jgi:uncharacterized protein (UPF0332 family)